MVTGSVDVTDSVSLHAAFRLAPQGGYIDMTTNPTSAVIRAGGTRVRVRRGHTVTRHDDGTITVTKTRRHTGRR